MDCLISFFLLESGITQLSSNRDIFSRKNNDTELTLGKKYQSESLHHQGAGCQINSFFNHGIIWKSAIYKLTTCLKAPESSKST